MTKGAKLLTAVALASAWLVAAQPLGAETLFKIVTVRDEIVVGLNDDEFAEIRGTDAGAVAAAIAARGSLTLWQYAVQRSKEGELQLMPLRKVGVLASTALRVEPYTTPYKIVPHE